MVVSFPMEIVATPIAEVKIIRPKLFADPRGFFLESYHQMRLESLLDDLTFVQDNHSRSSRHVLRGLHYQLHQPQGKLVRVARGAVFDVAVDIRSSSPTFGKWVGMVLSDENMEMAWIPPGFAHGFLTLSETADVLYKVTSYYDPASDRSLLWNDPGIGIEWPIEGVPLLSEKDARAKPLVECEIF
jgi:dTDP-4-dehydrorhamnose 3,5-epimerase